MPEWALTNVAMTASPLEADQHIQTHELDIIHSRMVMMVMTSMFRHTNSTYEGDGKQAPRNFFYSDYYFLYCCYCLETMIQMIQNGDDDDDDDDSEDSDW